MWLGHLPGTHNDKNRRGGLDGLGRRDVIKLVIGNAIAVLEVDAVLARRIEQHGSAYALIAAIRDPEHGQRAFLIAGRDVYLTPCNVAKQSLPKLIVELQDAAREIPEKQKLLLKLQADVTTKMNELAPTLIATRQNGFESARILVDNHLSRRGMDAISSTWRRSAMSR
jgi:CHASE3 domain sensor protein